MIHITHRGVVIRGSDADFAAAKRVFAAQHSLKLEGFVDSDLLAVVRRALSVAPFHDRSHDGIAQSCV